MVQWGGFEQERNEQLQIYKGKSHIPFRIVCVPHTHLCRHIAHWEENGKPELEIWRFDEGFAHGWGAGNNEEQGEMAEQRLAEHVTEHGGDGEGGHAWEYQHGYLQGLDAFWNFRHNNPDRFQSPPE